MRSDYMYAEMETTAYSDTESESGSDTVHGFGYEPGVVYEPHLPPAEAYEYHPTLSELLHTL